MEHDLGLMHIDLRVRISHQDRLADFRVQLLGIQRIVLCKAPCVHLEGHMPVGILFAEKLRRGAL